MVPSTCRAGRSAPISHRGAGTRQYRLAQDPKRVRLGAHVGRADPARLCLQGAAIAALAAALVWLWRSSAPYPLKAAALCLAAILATPYSFDYDMMVLAPAIAFPAGDGFARGFGPWEKTLLAALWLTPRVARSVAQASFIPLGVPAMLAVFVMILHRAGLASPLALSRTAAAE